MGRTRGTKRSRGSLVQTLKHCLSQPSCQLWKNCEEKGATCWRSSRNRFRAIENWKLDFKWEDRGAPRRTYEAATENCDYSRLSVALPWESKVHQGVERAPRVLSSFTKFWPDGPKEQADQVEEAEGQSRQDVLRTKTRYRHRQQLLHEGRPREEGTSEQGTRRVNLPEKTAPPNA